MRLIPRLQQLVNAAKSTKPVKESTIFHANANTQSAKVGGAQSSGDYAGVAISSREELKVHFPRLHELQEFHLKQLIEHKLPVHMSGKYDNILIPMVTVVTLLCFLYNVKWFLEFKK
uniref:Uncharacterized protein n=1 Tax=Ciona intestinalis TaxID=7719 RepID=F6PIL6_CIOIN